MKNKLKRGFTIVELVIVIAVIGILAGVLIPTFSNLINKANLAADESMVRNINNQLAIAEVQVGKNPTMHEALLDAQDAGYIVENINAKSKGNVLVWDQTLDRVALVEKETGSVIAGEVSDANNKVALWQTAESYTAGGYSIYLKKGYSGTADISGVNTGIDVGENENISSISYVSNSSQSVVIRTNGGALSIQAPNAEVSHHGYADSVSVVDVATASYHERGEVKFLEVSAGHIVLEQSAEVSAVHFTATGTGESAKFENSNGKKISIDLSQVSVAAMPTFSRDAVSIKENGTYVAEVKTESTEYIWLFGQGIKEQMVVTESTGAIAVNGTLKAGIEVGAEDGSVAEQIANPAKRNEQGELVDANDQVIDLTNVDLSSSSALDSAEVVVEEVASKEDVQTGATLFAGGTGSEIDPFLIKDYETFQHISELYEDGYHYFKVKDGVQSIDCSNWTPVNMNGSFDGRNASFNKLDNTLFGDLEGEVHVIKNFTVNANIITTDSFKAAVVDWAQNDIVIENVEVHGYLQAGQCASYIAFGPNGSKVINFTFRNCHSDITLVATSEQTAGFIDHPYCGSGSTLTLENSYYDGKQSNVKGKYNYYSYQVFTRLTVSDDYAEKSSLVSTNSYIKANSTVSLSRGTLAMPSVGGSFSVAKATGATYAVATLRIGPNDKNETGNYVGTYLTEECVLSGNNFTTSSIVNFNITINGSATTSTGVSGNTFNIVSSSYGTTYGSANVSIVQYDANNNVVSINEVSIKR